MKMSHEEYLEFELMNRHRELQEEQIKHRIHMAEYDLKVEMLRKNINSIEKQLDAAKK